MLREFAEVGQIGKTVSARGLSVVTSFAAGFFSGMGIASDGILSPAAISTVVAAVVQAGAAETIFSRIGTCCNACRPAYQAVYRSVGDMRFEIS